MVKNIGKFLLGGIAVAALGISALFGVRYFRMQSDPEYQQMREAQKIMGEWERLYREDTYGGTTPQETLSLFIEALKKGDTDLAAKYFVPDEREETITYLNDLKKDNRLDHLVEQLQNTRITVDGNVTFFTLVDQNNTAVSELVMHKNLQTGVWKITEL